MILRAFVMNKVINYFLEFQNIYFNIYSMGYCTSSAVKYEKLILNRPFYLTIRIQETRVKENMYGSAKYLSFR